ncbi:flavoprotein domain protein [Tessaracoccus sp. HDW20]|uniref:flavoprotein n=1 Tax=Tessaracoccus coleopterorum TaxID=2714950 RepID=UPI0018D417AD|nr:flavoprotein [Tessaracoccus coleopterorum]NHB84671.1 flavoprotein domain protein [Tessaracoccus coleopterorum]
MSENELRAMIAEIVAQALASEARAPESQRPNALVLFTGALLGFEASLESLGRAKSTVNLDWIQTDSASRILDQAAIERVGMTKASTSLVVSHDLLIVPTMTVNMIAKVVHGIGDCLASNVLSEFIMSGKPVVVATNAACPDSADKRGWFPAMPEGYAAMLRENLTRLASFGVKLSAAERLDRAVARLVGASHEAAVDCGERVISASTVAGMRPDSTVRIARAAIITDLALEAAASAHITLERV